MLDVNYPDVCLRQLCPGKILGPEDRGSFEFQTEVWGEKNHLVLPPL